MNIAGLSTQSLHSVNKLLQEVRTAVGAQSPGQEVITDIEAQAIVEAFGKLSPREQQIVGQGLQTLLQHDVFRVDATGRAAFAKALGVDTASLEPKATGGPVRSVLQTAMRAITRPAAVTQKTMQDLASGMRDAPAPLGQFVMSALKTASEGGEIKMDADARRAFTKEVAARNNAGVEGWLTNRFGDDFAKSIPPLAMSMLSLPVFFEDLLAAFLIAFVKETNEEVIREQLRFESLRGDQRPGASASAQAGQHAGQPAVQRAVQHTGTEAPAVDTATTTSSGRGVAGDGHGILDRAQSPSGGGKVMSTKVKLEAVISSVDARAQDGVISRDDALAIRHKLERFSPEDPVTKLLAEAIGTAMEHSGLLASPTVAVRLEPITSWVKDVTGTTSFPKPTALSSEKPLVRALAESDRLEHRLAAFLVDAFVDRGAGAASSRRLENTQSSAAPSTHDGMTSPVQSAVEKFKPLLVALLQETAPNELAPQTASRPPETPEVLLGRFERLVAARDKMPPGTVEAAIAKTVDRHGGQLEPAARQSLKEGLKVAFESLPKTGVPSSTQVRAAFERCVHRLVDDVDRGLAPDERHALAAAIDAPLAAGVAATQARLASTQSAGLPPSTTATAHELDGAIASQRERLLADARDAGYTQEQSDGLAAVFDRKAASARTAEAGETRPTAPTSASANPVESQPVDDTHSRQVMLEKLKFKMNLLSETMQALSNVLNSMHQAAENAIRAIR